MVIKHNRENCLHEYSIGILMFIFNKPNKWGYKTIPQILYVRVHKRSPTILITILSYFIYHSVKNIKEKLASFVRGRTHYAISITSIRPLVIDITEKYPKISLNLL